MYKTQFFDIDALWLPEWLVRRARINDLNVRTFQNICESCRLALLKKITPHEKNI